MRIKIKLLYFYENIFNCIGGDTAAGGGGRGGSNELGEMKVQSQHQLATAFMTLDDVRKRKTEENSLHSRDQKANDDNCNTIRNMLKDDALNVFLTPDQKKRSIEHLLSSLGVPAPPPPP
jgi:hypothetical protein